MFDAVGVHGIVAFVQLFAFVLLLSSVGVFCCKRKKSRRVNSRTNSAESINLQQIQGQIPPHYAGNFANPKISTSSQPETKNTPTKPSAAESVLQNSGEGSVPAGVVSITAVSTNTDKKRSVLFSKLMSTQRSADTDGPFESQEGGDGKKNAAAKSEGKSAFSKQEEQLQNGPFGPNPTPSLRKKSVKHRRVKMSREHVENTQESQRRASMVSVGKSSRRRNSAEQEESEDDNTMDGVKSISKDEVPSETQEETIRSTKN